MNQISVLRILACVFGAVIVLNIFTTLASFADPSEEALRLFTDMREYEIHTAELPSLDPHDHGAEDKVSDAHHGVSLDSSVITLEEDVWITNVSLHIQNAPHIVLHHINIFALLPQTPLSPPGIPGMGGWKEIMSLGQETPSEISLKKPYGILLPKGTKIRFNTMLHNPNPPKGPGEVYEHVLVSVQLDGSTTNDKTRTIPVALKRLVLSDPPTEELETFVVPPHTDEYIKHSAQKNGTYRDSSFTFPASGTIIRVGAHTHPWEGGTRVDAYLNGMRLMSFVPRMNGKDPWDYILDFSEIPIHVNAGDVLTLSATYTNPGDEPIVGAMGMVSVRYALDHVSSHDAQTPTAFSSLFVTLAQGFSPRSFK